MNDEIMDDDDLEAQTSDDMMDLALDENNDLDFDEDDLTIVDGDDEITQSLGIILRTRQGEFFDDEEMGLDTSNLLGRDYDEDIGISDIIQALEEQDSRVADVDVNDLDVDDESRNLSISLSITLNDDPDNEIDMEEDIDD